LTKPNEKYRIQKCPYCGKRQKIGYPEPNSPRYLPCKNFHCINTFYVNDDATLRQITDQEAHNLTKIWINFWHEYHELTSNLEVKV